jgi:hypothetical protein
LNKVEFMSYDVYITRADNWVMNDGVWIELAEWLQVVKHDPELEIVTESDPYCVEWIGNLSGEEYFLNWKNGNISAKNPTKELIIKMESLSLRLRAKVQDDDGDIYVKGEVFQE